MNGLEYTKKVMKHFLHPKHKGKIENADAVGKAGSPICGDIMYVYLKIDKKTNRIKDAKFQTMGCVAAIATSDVACGLAKGKTISQAEKITPKDIVKALGKLPHVKYHCSILGEEALKNAIENYKKKNKSRK